MRWRENPLYVARRLVAVATIAGGAADRRIPWAIEPGTECDRCAAKRPAESRTVTGAAWASPDRARLD